MVKRILPILLLVAICFTSFMSCNKSTLSTDDITRNYFPLKLGKYVRYAVDSVYYFGKAGTRYEVKSEMKYVITDTYTVNRKLSYIMDVYSRPYDGGDWIGTSVILITPTATGLLYTQDRTQYLKMTFPISNGVTWKGNMYAEVQDSMFSYLKDWNYTYQSYPLNYFNGLVQFDKTVTINECNQDINYQAVDSNQAGFHTYAKEVYAYGVGMIYKEWTHYTFHMFDTSQNRNGYSVIMRAIDYN